MRKVKSIKVNDGKVEREISLYYDNITDLSVENQVDILVASAFPNDYLPTRTSLIGALHRKGLSVAELAVSKEIDLRQSSGFWLSHTLGEDAGSPVYSAWYSGTYIER